MAFDGIVTKKIVDELQNLIGYKIDKIYVPDKNTVLLGLYGNHSNVSLLSSISSNNYRIHLTTNIEKNPSTASNFCMLLRKHILGYRIKRIQANGLERLVFIDLENSDFINPDNIDNTNLFSKKLVIELMGKHSNIILLDNNGIIIDSFRHTFVEKNAQRDIYPTARYFEPNVSKINFLKTQSFEDFFKALSLKDSEDCIEKITNKFNGISLSTLNGLDSTNSVSYSSTKLHAHTLYDNLLKLLKSNNLTISTIYRNNLPVDYYLIENNSSTVFPLNYALDDFYYQKESNELFKNYRNTLLNIVFSTLKKYEKRLENIDDKLDECKKMDDYKLYGELLTANLYKMPKYHISSIKLENYYNNNSLIEIPLDKKISPQQNANKFYKKYTKLKNALEIVSKQKEETKKEIDYIESIVYELGNCININNIQEIYDEICENAIFKITNKGKKSGQKKSSKPKQITTNKYASFNPMKFTIDGYSIYVGRNNKENDYLTNKYASKNDIWFHAKEIHGSHVILKNIPGQNIPENVVFEAAKLAAKHSKAKDSSNVPVDYCLVQYVKKVSGNKPGLVIYKKNKTIYV